MTSLAEAYNRIRHAADFVSAEAGDMAVVSRNGGLYAHNRVLAAAEEFDDEVGDFITTSHAFKRAMQRISAPVFKMREGFLRATQQGERRYYDMPLLDLEVFDERKPSGERQKVVPELFYALKACSGFTGNDRSRPWMCAVRVEGNNITATSGVALYQHTLEQRVSDAAFSLPAPLADFMRSRDDDPSHWALTDDAVSFWFARGWVTASRLNAEMPDNVPAVLDNIIGDDDETRDGCIELDRKEVKKVLTWLDGATGAIDVYPDRLHAPAHVGEDTIEFDMDLGDNARIQFDAKPLHAVLAIATHVGFNHYPGPIPFFSEHGRGAIAGRN